VAEGLRTYFARWQPGARERIVERRSVPASQSPADAPRASSHVVRLWAAQEAGRTASTNRPHAVEVAVAHQIVTPFTGAVVLETAEQYERNGLEPAKSGSTPNVTPEPRTWILIAIGVFVLMALRARAESRRRTR
jgi:hypothetical protein